MKKIIAIAGSFVLVIGMLALTGCGVKTDYEYDDADKYTAGDLQTSAKIEKIDIDYLAGNVDIVTNSSGEIKVTETANKDLEDEQKVRTWVDGTTLRIKYCAPVKKVSFGDLEKNLTVSIPEKTSLSELQIDMAAGDIHYDSVLAEKLSIDAAAGNIVLSLKNVPKETDIDAAAGDVKIKVPEDSGIKLELDKAAGDFKCVLPHVSNEDKEEITIGDGSNEMNIDIAAGDVSISAL